jgi:uncharacterized protein (UPF0261 family)
MKAVYVVGTCDTKAAELAFIRSSVMEHGMPVVLVDVSTRQAPSESARPDVTAAQVAACHPDGAAAVFNAGDRGGAIAGMAQALAAFLATRVDLGGVIGAGGSGNTALVTEAMRVLPIGLPKLMVSTVASGNVAPYVGASDIAMMYSVVDIAGLNHISRTVLGNAAHAMAGMVQSRSDTVEGDRASVGITMFGVTTPCVDQLRERLKAEYECFVFHATGTGGQSLEKLVDSGLIGGVLDITTTEVADHLVGGVFPCTDDRFGAIARTGVPYVGSCGALDMVNFGAMSTVPDQFAGRTLYAHNSQVTLMRTSIEENRRTGAWIASKLNRCKGRVRFLIPEKGVSAIDAPGQPFFDPVADEALFSALETGLEQTADRRIVRLDMHINAPEFADAAVEVFKSISN